MKKLLLLSMSLSVAACVADPGEVPDDGSGSNTPPSGTDISGSITQSGTWSGNLLVKAPATIEAGTTITVAAGTTLTFAGSATLTVKGTLDIQGTAAAKVNLKPSGSFFGGINNSGTLKMAYAIQKGGGVYGQAGAITITDSQLSGVQGDLIVLSGGTFTASYSQFGVDRDTTHCELHFNNGTGAVSITKSIIRGAPYGFMFYGGAAGVYTDNNWIGNTTHVDFGGGTGDFSRGHFDRALSALPAGVTANNLSAAPLTNVGPRG